MCFFCCAMAACNSIDTRREVIPAFYHWQTKLQLAPAERNYLDALGVKKLYVKFFDVDWDEAAVQPVPLAAIEMDTTLLSGIEIVPCVFITNRTLLNLPMQQVDTLAYLISKKIASLVESPPNEIQFDCDWTALTREKYFALINSFRQHQASSTQHPASSISATIRLHQFKYPDKAGVPPVDRGMLMCYNMGDLEDWDTENSIIDPTIAAAYLPPQSEIRNPKSEIPLDIALPSFRWGVLFRDGEMIKLLNDLSEVDLSDLSRFVRTAPNRYEVLRSTYLHAHYLYEGDQIRLEAATPETVADVAALLNNKVALGQALTVAFYHLDTTTVKHFPKGKIEEVLQQF
ncbi:MAG: hypothetical protein IPN76_01020 [Saprospiraceae bacterium]|nr:hypothetical protein [Saprospiraceae bacterium]